MFDKKNFTKIARITRTHGTSGELVLSNDIDQNNFIFLDIDGGLVPFQIEDIRANNIIRLHLCDDLDTAKILVNTDVYVKTEDIDQDHIPIESLIGFQSNYGKIVDLDLSVEQNPLFIINYQNREILVPLNDNFIRDIDPIKKIITFDLPIELLNL